MEEERMIDLDHLSDIESLSSCSSSSSCMTSITDLSIYHEFDCMIAELHAIQQAQHNVIYDLHRIRDSIQSTDHVQEEEEFDETQDLKEAIQQFHLQSLKQIESSLPSTFTEDLLKWIDTISSEKESENEYE